MKQSNLLRFIAFLGYVFLYAPILVLVIYSFNASSLVSVWSGFSLKWYHSLFKNESLLQALFASFEIAAMSATLATFLGTMASISMVRYKRFRGRTLFSSLLSSPLMMPDIITGLGLLLFFVSLSHVVGWPEHRGLATVTIAHTTLGVAYVYLIVKARLKEFDRSLEEAALDLGAKPLNTFFSVTLPIISPSLLAGWLLSFALSLDDLVLASFLSGPGATTLPMVIFSSLRLGLSPEINALGTLLIAFIALLIGLIGFRLAKERQT